MLKYTMKLPARTCANRPVCKCSSSKKKHGVVPRIQGLEKLKNEHTLESGLYTHGNDLPVHVSIDLFDNMTHLCDLPFGELIETLRNGTILLHFFFIQSWSPKCMNPKTFSFFLQVPAQLNFPLPVEDLYFLQTLYFLRACVNLM